MIGPADSSANRTHDKQKDPRTGTHGPLPVKRTVK